MKLLVLAGTVLFASSGVLAADFVWTGGGTAGDWTSSANWGVDSGYPQAGDTATFNDNVTITSDFSLSGTEDTDVLKVTVASGVTLTIDASISGTGGVTREGSGTLVLKRTNPFTGKFQANGWSDKKVDNPNILTVIYDGGALGTCEACFDNSVNYSYSALKLDMSECADRTMTISIPLKLCKVVSKTNRPNLQIYNGNVTFEGDIDGSDRLVLDSDDGDKVVRFKGRVIGTSNAYFQPGSSFSSGSHIHIENEVSLNRVYLYGVKAVVHLGAARASAGLIDAEYTSYAASNVCECADVFQNIGNSGFPWSSHNSTAGGRIDLNGFDQHFPNSTKGCVIWRSSSPFNPISNYGFTSPDDRPAKVILDGNKITSQLYNGKFFGSAGFEWNPTDETSVFTFSNAVSTTSGELTVGNGTVLLFDGASFTGLSKLSVAEGATFAADELSARDFFAQEIDVSSGATLALPNGVTLVTKKFVVGGEEVTQVGRYTKEEYPAIFDGDGAVEIKGIPCAWIGASGGLWSDPANWEGGKVPGGQCDVTIPSGKSVVLAAANDPVNRVTIGGGEATATLTMSGWNTCFQARFIEVADKGVVTTPGAFTNEADKARVWIKCQDLTLDEGAVILMDGMGWMGGHYDLSDTSKANPSGACYNDDGVNRGGWGPGRTRDISAGASHLGQGGYSLHGLGNSGLGPVYDDPFSPVEPGSGGYGLQSSSYQQAWTAIGSGGGAVRIEATGAVVVDGEIRASGASSSTHPLYNGGDSTSKNNQAGSGGSVWISCETISGVGEIHADGGNGGYGLGTSLEHPNGVNSTGMPGGGGGVAITYDTAKQQVGAVAGMKISAAAGHFIRVEGGTRVNDSGLTWATVDDCWRSSEPGTLYLADANEPTDTRLVDDLIGKGLSGRLFSLTNYTYVGNLDWEYGYVRFGATGAVFTVTGDLSVTGEWSRLDLGGNFVRTNWTAQTYVDAGDQMVTLNVGGDFSVSNGALFAVYAAAVTNEYTDCGAAVNVGGAFVVGEGGRVRPVCNSGYGGSPRFTVGSFVLDRTGKVDAEGRGCAGGWTHNLYPWLDSHNRGIGIGATDGVSTGASHGGRGGYGYKDGVQRTGTPSEVVDDPYRPVLSGAGGGAVSYSIGGSGGGVFHLVASGAVSVNGEINVSGLPNVTYSTAGCSFGYASGAGGTIFLCGSTFKGAASARLLARGGAAITTGEGQISGGGAGGRIALWFGREKTRVEHHRERHSTSVADARLDGGFANWFGTADAGGGTNMVPCNISYTMTEPMPASWGGAGTVTYNGFLDPMGMQIMLR